MEPCLLWTLVVITPVPGVRIESPRAHPIHTAAATIFKLL